MSLSRSIIFILFFFTVSAFAQDDTRAAATWQVQKYDINVTLPSVETDRNLSAKAVLTIKNVSSSPASTLSLRISPSAEISAITVNGAAADFAKREEKVGASGSLQRVTSRIPSVQPSATATVSVDYKLNLKENSGLSSVSPVGSTFLPLSYWYPTPNSWYFARGADYAPFQIKVTAALGKSVVSAGSENSGIYSYSGGGQPFFVSGSWDTVNTGGISVYIPKGAGAEARNRADELSRLAVDARTFVSSLLGPGPDTPLRIIAARRGAGFSQGGTILVDESLFRRSRIDSQTAMNIAEAVAKLWIGGATSVLGDGQGAIREGMPRFIANEFIESKFGKDVADVERTRQRSAYSSVSLRDAPLTTVSPIDDYYFAEVANKGAMVWRLLDKRAGRTTFLENIRAVIRDGSVDLPEIRAAFQAQKELLDYLFDHVTDINLLVGLPQPSGNQTSVALRNSGGVDVTVNIEALTATGERLAADTTIRATSFGEVTFKTTARVTRVEIDTEKLYPQTEYSDDVAPKELNEGDVLLAVKRLFDKQDFAGAEAAARTVLRRYPRYDEVRILLARSLLGLNRQSDAANEFKAVVDEKLPAAKSIAWANVGLGEIAAKAGQNVQAAKYAETAILADADYGASLAARNIRNRVNAASVIDAEIKEFFARFDKAATANRKAEVDALIVPGEVTRFSSGVSGSTEQWQTQVSQVDKLDDNTSLVETNLSVKLLNREPESGLAVFRLVKTAAGWKLAAVDMFEVR
jgi:tetratricopeptide (TPR) repeat protein